MMRLYIISILFFVLSGCACWFTTYISNEIKLIISLVSIFCWNKYLRDKNVKIPSYLFVGLMGFALVQLISSKLDFIYTFASTLMIFAVCTPLLLSYQHKEKLLDTLNHIFYYLVLISLVLHICKILGLLPYMGMFERGHYVYQNYYFYLYSPDYELKFCGFCWEPGFFSLLLSALLLINKYDFTKKQGVLYLISLLLTFSLGGYILSIVCRFLYSLINKGYSITNLIIKSSILASFIIILFLVLTQYWNAGNNIVNELVLNKLVLTYSESSLFESRQSSDALYVWRQFIESGDKWLGLGYHKYVALRSDATYYDAASISQFILINGIIGTFVQLATIAYMCFKKMNYRYSILGFVFLLLDFLQHGYGILSSMYLLIVLWISYSSKQMNITKCIK